jgi:hypothetical protein
MPGKRFIMRAEEKLTAFFKLEAAIFRVHPFLHASLIHSVAGSEAINKAGFVLVIRLHVPRGEPPVTSSVPPLSRQTLVPATNQRWLLPSAVLTSAAQTSRLGSRS